MKRILAQLLLALLLTNNGFSEPATKPLFPNHQFKAQVEMQRLSEEEQDMDWSLNEYFGTVIVINLEDQKERLATFTKNLEAIGVKDFEVFKAINGRKDVDSEIWQKFNFNWARLNLSNEESVNQFNRQRQGEAGCYLSHYEVLKLIKGRFDKALAEFHEAEAQNNKSAKKEALRKLLKNRSVVILEDDNGFGITNKEHTSASTEKAGQIFRKAMADLPLNWDMFYFMTYSHPGRRNTPYSENLAKVLGGYTTSAYAVNHTQYGNLVKILGRIYAKEVTDVYPIDNMYAAIHPAIACFAANPSIAYQTSGESLISGVKKPFYLQIQPLTK